MSINTAVAAILRRLLVVGVVLFVAASHAIEADADTTVPDVVADTAGSDGVAAADTGTAAPERNAWHIDLVVGNVLNIIGITVQ